MCKECEDFFTRQYPIKPPNKALAKEYIESLEGFEEGSVSELQAVFGVCDVHLDGDKKLEEKLRNIFDC